MSCIKTGAQIYIVPFGVWCICDAFEVADAIYFRIAGESDVPERDALHFEVGNYENWWDRHAEGRCSTMICNTSEVVSHGYDGDPITNLIPSTWS